MRHAVNALQIIRSPSGYYVFAGSVPDALATVCSADDPAVVADLREVARHAGMALARRRAARLGVTFGTRAFVTRDAAIEAAAEIGVTVAGA